MLQYINKIINHNIFKAFSILSLGAIISQIITIASTPILARIYSPESYGIFAFFLSLNSIIVIIATGKLELSLMIPKSNSEIRILINYIFFWLYIFIIIITFVIFLLFLAGTIKYHYLLLPIALLLQGYFNIYNYLLIRKGEFKLLANSIIIRSVGIALFSYSFSFLFRNELGLIIGFSLGLFFSVIYSFIKYPTKFFIRSFASLKKFKHIFQGQIQFPSKSVPASLLNILSAQAPIIILSALYPSNIIGVYFQAHRLLYAPINLVSNSLSKVLYKQITERINNKLKYSILLKNISLVLFGIGIIPGLLIFFFGEELFVLFLGKEWELTGTFATIIIPWLLIVLVIGPLTVVFEALKKQLTLAKLNLLLLFFRIIALYIGYYIFNDAFYSIGLFTGVSVLIWSIIAIKIFSYK